jgi:excisionase family DNA binding protein
MTGESPVLTVTDVAAMLHVHRVTIYRLLEQRKLPAFKIGRIWRFDRREVEALFLRRGRPVFEAPE